MTVGQQIVADWRRRYQPYEPQPDRVIVREERAFYAVDGERVVYAVARHTEERYS